MSKPLDINSLKSRVTAAQKNLAKYFNDLLDATKDEDKALKRASLLAYWIKDYLGFLKAEDSFDPSSLIRYSRGDILRVNFGYRIGNELGGSHYAIVLDARNAKTSGLITVLPLMSHRPDKTPNKYRLELLCGVKGILVNHIEVLKSEINELSEKVEKSTLERLKRGSVTEAQVQEIQQLIRRATQKLELAKANLAECSRLNDGTVVNVGQIITVSKQRILYPKDPRDVLCSCKVTPEDMNRIDEKLMEIYF